MTNVLFRNHNLQITTMLKFQFDLNNENIYFVYLNIKHSTKLTK